MRRLELIERNRMLLAVKLFPASLLCLNPLFFVTRIAAGVVLGQRGAGDTAHFPGWSGKCKMAWALLRGHLQGLGLAPRMWRKRPGLERFRRLDARAVRRLILSHRLRLRDVV
jgi:hypothetical protein